MLIIGAKGFAKEILEILYQNNDIENLVFYDDVNPETDIKLFNRFLIIKTEQEAIAHFKNKDKRFVLGVGNPKIRKLLYEKFILDGGDPTSLISHNASVGRFDVEIGNGTNIMDYAVVSNNVKIGVGCLIYYNTNITHDCILGDFVELSPGATILGRCIIGQQSQIGANATILPDIRIGNNVIVGAGAVVTNDLPDNCTAVGVPAKIIKQY